MIANTHTGTMTSPRVASELSGVPLGEIMKLLDSGHIRHEWKRGKLYVSLDDVEANAPHEER